MFEGTRFVDRPLGRRSVLGVGLGLVAVPLLQACGGAASPTAAARSTTAAATGGVGASGSAATTTATTPVAGAAATTTSGAPTSATSVAAAGQPTGTAAVGTSAAGTTGTSTAGTAGTSTAGTTGTSTPGAAGTSAAATTGTSTAGATGTATAAGSPVPAAAPQIQKVGGTVSVLATWGGDEQQTFMSEVKPWEDASGAKMQYEGTRDLNAVLTTRVSAGNPPDLAGLPGPGAMAQFAKQGKLIDLANVLDMNTMKQWYSQDWLSLAQADGKQVGIFIKSAYKSLIWFDPKTFQQGGYQQPKTWDEMMALSQKIAATGTTPWAIGLESGATSGWPGTDWLSDILLRQAGGETYDGWWQGKVKWTSDQVRKAWQTWGQIVGDPKMVYGGKQTMLSTNFGDAANPLFQNPPKAYLHHQANFMTSFIEKANPSLKPGTDFDVFQFPDVDSKYAGAGQTAGDLFGMFKDTPQARSLMNWLVTPDAQQIWVKAGGALSPNKAVPASAYPDPIARKAADFANTGKLLRFSAGDLMPDAMTQGFYKGILDFVNNPGSLDSILANLDKTQADAYKT